MFPFLSHPSFALFLLRVTVGIAFIAHGYPKLFKNFSNFSGWLGSLGFKPAKLWALVAGIVEFFGGIALVLGIFVQPAGLLIAFQMLVVMTRLKWGRAPFTGQDGWELELMYCIAALTIAFSGPGIFAW